MNCPTFIQDGFLALRAWHPAETNLRCAGSPKSAHQLPKF